MVKYRFVNGVRVPRSSSYDSCRHFGSDSVVPNRAISIQDLAYRLQNGLPMPQMTTYRIYDDVGLRHVSEPTDLISAFNMVKEFNDNSAKISDLRNVSKSKENNKSDSKEVQE